jgi:hypothetical protein
VDPVFAQYGAMGVVAALAITAVKVLFNRAEREQKREQDRADRLEAEVRELNRLIHTSYSAVLNDATKAVAEALAFLRQYRRR